MRTLLGVVVVLTVLVPADAVAQNKKKAREHFNQGEAYMQAGVYDLAIQEYQAAYTLVPTAHGFLFNIGLAYEKLEKKQEALDHYKQFLDKEPNSPKAPETKARIIALERKLEDEREAEKKRQPERTERVVREATGPTEPARPTRTGGKKDIVSADDNTAPVDPIQRPRDDDRPGPDQDDGLSWGWIALGAGVFAAGLAVDWAPDSADNGEVDVMDFVPLGLYGLGGYFVVRGVF